ncbi:MAG: hypothetical protein RIC85_03925 [Gammaproteobacteria bacterium]
MDALSPLPFSSLPIRFFGRLCASIFDRSAELRVWSIDQLQGEATTTARSDACTTIDRKDEAMSLSTKIALGLLALGIVLAVIGIAAKTSALTALGPLLIAIGVIILVAKLIFRVIGKPQRRTGRL